MAVFRILYVDDEPGLLELGKIFLEQSGQFIVDTIVSAPKALAQLDTTKYDAIVSDYQMPGMDGIEFLKRVRKSGNIIPFVLFTGRGREQVVIQALNEGADFYIQKGGEPVSQFAELAHKIRQAIQKRLAEGQLQESQAQLRTIVNSIQVGIVTIDATTHRILNVNPKAAGMFGAEPDAIVGQVCHTFICPAQAGACPVTDCGQTVDLSERVLLDRNGNRLPILKSVVRTVLDGRDVLVESFFDLSDRKQTEEEVRQKNARLRTLNDLEREFAGLPAGQRVEGLAAKKLSALSGAVVTVFCTYDPVQQVQNVAAMEFAPGTLERLPGGRDKVARWLGTRPEDLHVPIKKEMYLDFSRSIVGMKKTITEISNGYIPSLVGSTIQKFAGIDRFIHIAHIIDGELYATSVIGMKPGQPDPERELLESFAHMVATSLRRQQAEASLRESEDRYRTLIENADEAILVVQDNRVCFANPKLVEISGYSRQEYEQKPFLEFIHPDDRNMIGEQHRRRLSGEALTEHYTFRILAKGGTILWNEIRSSLISWNGQKAVLAILQDITERKKAEEALRESEAKFRALVDQSIDGIIIVDFMGRLLFANNSVAQFTGYDLSLVGKLNVLDLLSPEYRLQAMSDFALVAAGTDGYPAEYKILGAGKKEMWIECIAKKISFAGSSAMILSLRDLSGRQRAEISFRSREEFFREITENLTSVFYVHDRESNNFVYVSPAYEKIWMRSRKELYDDPYSFLAAVHPEDLPRLQESIRGELENGVYVDTEYRIIRPDGTIRWIRSRNFPVIGGKGTVYRVAGAADDITDVVNSRLAVKESEEKFRSLVEYALEAILILDLDGTVLMANKATADLVETGDCAGLAGRNVMEFIAPESREDAIKDFQQVARGHDAYIAEYTLITAKGNRISVESIGKVISYEGRPADLISLRDITGRRQTEDALRLANRQLSLLTGITRHDILNKISVITGFLAIAAMKTSDPAMGTYLKKIEIATDAIRSQIEFTRLYHELGTLQPRWLALDEVMPRSHVPPSISLNADGKEIRVLADPMLEKVFSNLLDNTIRHGQQVSTIRITTHRAGDALVVVWEDDGVGIPADEKERIFERGFGKNTGLGMFLAREILALTDITITESGEPGKGARFEITVPKGAYRVAGE